MLDTTEYDALLGEAISKTDTFKAEISELAVRLYSDLGKSFKADDELSSPHFLGPSHAIFVSLARVCECKGS